MNTTHNTGKTWVVYIHTCLINQKSYVGITCKKPESRWGHNGNGYKGQAFYYAIQRYGWDNFEHKIIATDLSEENAKQLEISLIAQLQTHISKNGYNVSLGGDGFLGADNKGEKNPMYGKCHTEETKRKISEANKGRPGPMLGKHHTEEAKKKMSENHWDCSGENNYWYGKINKKMIEASAKAKSKSVCQFDLEMELIKIYPSELEAERQTNIDHSNIAACCKYKNKTSGGFIWIYESELIKLSELKISLIENLIDTNKLKYGKAVYQFDKELNFINEFMTLHDAEKETGISRNSISYACRGIFKMAEGYIWAFKEDVKDIESFKENYNVNLNRVGKHVYQYDFDGNLINEYISCAEAGRKNNIPRTSVSKTCLGKQHSAGGFIWSFYKLDEENITKLKGA